MYATLISCTALLWGAQATPVLEHLHTLRDAQASPADAQPLGRRATTVSAVGPVATIASSGAYPRANSVTYSDGTSGLIGGYTSTADDTYTLMVVQSNNTGNTWDVIGSVAQGASTSHDIDNPYLLQLASGRIIYAYRNHDKDSTTGDYTYYRITVSYSDDFGANWLFLSQVVERAATSTNNGVWEPFLRLSNDGTTVQCYYSSENSQSDQDSYMKYSSNGGETWSDAIQVSGQDVTSRDGMTGVAVVSGDTLMSVSPR